MSKKRPLPARLKAFLALSPEDRYRWAMERYQKTGEAWPMQLILLTSRRKGA